MKDTDNTIEQLIQERELLQLRIKQLEVEQDSTSYYDDLHIGINNVDIMGNFTYVNKRFLEVSGYSKEEIIGKNAFKMGIFPSDSLKLLLERMKDRLLGKPSRYLELQFKCKDGRLISVELIGRLMKTHGVPVGFQISTRDITDRKNAEKELKQRIDQLSLVNKYSFRLSTMEDPEEIITFVCSVIKEIVGTGYVLGTLMDEATQTLSIKAMEGFHDEKLINKIIQLLGADPRRTRFSVTEIAEAELKLFRSGRLELIEGGIYTLLTRRFPQTICVMAERILGIRFAYALGFVYLSRHLGEVIILSDTENAVEEKRQIIETLVNEASILISRSFTSRALQQSEEQLRTSLENAPDGVYMSDLEGRFLYSNPRYDEIIGYSHEELMGKSLLELNVLTEEGITRAAGLLQDNIQGKSTGPEEFEFIKKDGHRIPVEINTSLVQRLGQTVVLGFVRDITIRRQAENALKASEAKYRAVIEAATDQIFMIDKEMKILSVNSAAASLFNEKPEYMVGKKLNDIFPKQIFDNISLNISEVLATGMNVRKEDYLVFQGKNTWNSTSLYPMKDLNNEVIAVIGIVRDITGIMKAELDLRDSVERFNQVATIADEFIWEVDENGVYSYCSPAVERILGYSADELVGQKHFYDLFTLEVRDELKEQALANFDRKQSILNFVNPNIHKNGSMIYLETNGLPMLGEKGNLMGYRGVDKDITERKQSEKILIQSEQNFRSSIDNSPLGVLIVSSHISESNFLYSNQAFLDIYGYSSLQEFRTIRPEQRFTPQGYIGYMERREKRLRGEPVSDSHETSIVRKDGTVRYLQVLVKEVIWEGKKQNQLIHIDITERKRADENLRQSNIKLQETLDAAVTSIAYIAETRDPYTTGHQVRVSALACAIAVEMGLSGKRIGDIKTGGLLHDIGKLIVPAEILSRPGKLNDNEFSLIKQHPKVGYDIIKKIEFPCQVAQMVIQHHERIDGSGYPGGLRGDDITIEAKVIAVADVVEAMSSHRPYRPALGIDKALEEISKNAGTLYDTTVGNACLKLFNEKGFKFEG